jgi:hypothetical protein
MKSIAKIEFESPVNRDNGTTNEPLGTHKSTMELFAFDDGHYSIEWDIPALDTTEEIGIWHNNKTLTDYDGVFELPNEAIKLLENNGFIVPDEFHS